MKLQLLPYEKSDAATVVSWASTATEIFRWAGMTEPPTLSDFDRWHADADIHPMVGYVKGKQLAYGELWVDPVQREIELGRIIVHPAHRSPSPSFTQPIVHPAHRGLGIGQSFVLSLVDQTRSFPFNNTVVRVIPDNANAIRCYQSAGFASMSAKNTTTFNREQPREYVWMRHHGNPCESQCQQKDTTK